MTTASWKCKLVSAALAVFFTSSSIWAQTVAPKSTSTQAATTTAAPTATSAPAASKTTATPAATATGGSDAVKTTAAPTEGAETAPEPAETDAEDAAAPASTEALDGATYRVRLRDLEQRVDELKEQIRRSHTRLSLLSDTILSGASGGARAEIEFVNDLSGAWHLVEAVFVLDGAVQYKKTDDTGVLAKQKRIPIFSGSVPTGDHTLQVMLKLRGHGYGVFSYLRGIEASVTTDHSFTLTGGKVLELKATAWEKGGPTTPVEEQPDIRFDQTIRSATDSPTATPLATPAKSTASPKAGASSKGNVDSDAKDGKVGGGLSVGGGGSDK